MKLLVRTIAIATVTFALGSGPAFPLSIVKPKGAVNVSFQKGSSVLPNSSKVQLARHIPRLNAMRLEVIIIEATGDRIESPSNKDREMSLAQARAQSVRHFFLDAGYPEQRIYTDAKLVPKHANRRPHVAVPSLGTADVQYIGLCKEGYWAICYEGQ